MKTVSAKLYFDLYYLCKYRLKIECNLTHPSQIRYYHLSHLHITSTQSLYMSSQLAMDNWAASLSPITSIQDLYRSFPSSLFVNWIVDVYWCVCANEIFVCRDYNRKGRRAERKWTHRLTRVASSPTNVSIVSSNRQKLGLKAMRAHRDTRCKVAARFPIRAYLEWSHRMIIATSAPAKWTD